jgi:hypothetical protein
LSRHSVYLIIVRFDSIIRFGYNGPAIPFTGLTILNNGYSAAIVFETASTLTAENLNSGILP